MAVASPDEGELVGDRFRVQGALGAGKRGQSYKATDIQKNRTVLLKTYDATPKSKGYEALKKELERLNKIPSSHVPALYDHGKGAGGLIFVAYEWVEGSTVAELIKADGAMDPKRVTILLRKALESLEFGHELGLVHGDLRPPNLMVAKGDDLRLLDYCFTNFAALATESEPLGAGEASRSTLRYMSPEQIQGDDLSPASDIYSLGLTVYEMLMGEPAITDDNRISIIGLQLDAKPFQLPEHLIINDGLRLALNTMLLKEPQGRFQSATEALRALDSWLGSEDEGLGEQSSNVAQTKVGISHADSEVYDDDTGSTKMGLSHRESTPKRPPAKPEPKEKSPPMAAAITKPKKSAAPSAPEPEEEKLELEDAATSIFDRSKMAGLDTLEEELFPSDDEDDEEFVLTGSATDAVHEYNAQQSAGEPFFAPMEFDEPDAVAAPPREDKPPAASEQPRNDESQETPAEAAAAVGNATPAPALATTSTSEPSASTPTPAAASTPTPMSRPASERSTERRAAPAPAPAPDTPITTYIIIGVVVLLLLGGGIWFMTQGSSTTSEVDEGTSMPVIEAAPITHSVRVRTSPPALRVTVNGRPRGLSPVTLELREDEFPVRVGARMNANTEITELVLKPVDELMLDFNADKDSPDD